MTESSNQPSLMVLSGPKAGTTFVLEDAVDNILIGSDPSCRFVLDVPGVSPIHARLWVDASGATLYDTNSPAGVYVNDNRVTGATTLRNGDIVWLGTPGELDAVMVQCYLPERSAAGEPEEEPEDVTATLAFKGPLSGLGASVHPEPMLSDPDALGDETVAEPPPPEAALHEEAGILAPEDETVAQASEETIAVPEDETVAEPSAEAYVMPADETMSMDVDEMIAVPSEPLDETLSEPPGQESTMALLAISEPPVVEAAELVDAAPEPEVVVFDHEPPPAAPDPYEAARSFTGGSFDIDDEGGATMAVSQPPTVWDIAPEPKPVAAPEPPFWETPPRKPLFERPPEHPPAFEDEMDPTMADAPAPAKPTPSLGEGVTIAIPSEQAPTVMEKAPAPRLPEPETARMPPPAPRPEPPAPFPPPRVAPPRAAPRSSAAPPRAAASPSSPRPAPAPRVERPAPAPIPEAAPRERPAAKGGNMGAIAAGIGVLALLVAGGAWYVLSRPGTPEPSPVPVADAAPPSPVAAPPSPLTEGAPAEGAPAEVAPEPTPAPLEEETTVVRTPPPSPRTSPGASPARPSPVVAQSQRPGQPPPVTAPTGPTPEALRAQQVAGYVIQGQAAAAARGYDVAIAQFDEALKLDPQNAAALQGKSAAVASRAASRKKFVTGRTVVQTGKAGGGVTGFESSDVNVQKAPDFQGRIDFEMSPPTPQPGGNYSLKIFLVNEGKKNIKVSGLTVNTTTNGARGGGPVAPRVKEVAPSQRVLLEEMPGAWPQDVSSWSSEVVVSAGKGESLKNQITWR